MLASALRDQLISTTELHLQILIEQWQNLDPDLLEGSPQEGAWSAVQCLDHLNFYGRYYLPLIAQAIEKAKPVANKDSLEFKSGWLGSYFTELMKKDPAINKKAKLKAPKNARPRTNLDTRKVVAEFIDHLENLQSLLKKSSSVNINRIRIPISISTLVRLRLGDVFSFVVAHNERHIRQASRAIASARVKIPA